MKVRAYINGYVDVEISSDLAALELVIRGATDADADETSRALYLLDREINDRLPPLDLGDTCVESWSAICRSCGCTEEMACPGGCHWVEADLCSACSPEAKP